MRDYHLCKIEAIKTLCEALDHDQYSEKLEVLSNGSIGQHIRHIVEFYVCLLDGLDTGSVNYEKRNRDLLMEQSPMAAIEVLNKVQTQIQNCDLLQTLDLEHELGNEVHFLKTSLSRELHYLSEHNIHHFALIKIGIKSAFTNIELPENFGVADSTVKHIESICVS